MAGASVENRLPPRHRGSCRGVGHLTESRCDGAIRGERKERELDEPAFFPPIKIIDSQRVANEQSCTTVLHRKIVRCYLSLRDINNISLAQIFTYSERASFAQIFRTAVREIERQRKAHVSFRHSPTPLGFIPLNL